MGGGGLLPKPLLPAPGLKYGLSGSTILIMPKFFTIAATPTFIPKVGENSGVSNSKTPNWLFLITKVWLANSVEDWRVLKSNGV